MEHNAIVGVHNQRQENIFPYLITFCMLHILLRSLVVIPLMALSIIGVSKKNKKKKGNRNG